MGHNTRQDRGFHAEGGTIGEYSREIADAWEVLHKVYELRGFREIVIRRFSESDGWEVLIRVTEGSLIPGTATGGELGHENVADYAPLAICRAALKAVGL